MLQHRGEVLVELEFLEVSRSALVSYGLALPKEFPMAYLGRLAQNLLLSIPPGFSRFGVFGGGKTLFGIGLSDAELVARLTRSAGRNLLRAQVRSMDGQPATFNVGEQYPIVTNGYFGPIQNPGLPVFTPPPAFNYENLGLSMKFTPRIHSSREVTLELEAEFKLLAGQAINGIPVLSTRKLQTKIRLENGEYGMVAGLMNASEARTISGLAGLSNIPVLGHLTRKTDHNDTGTELLIMIRPRLLAPAPESATSRPLFLGSESRWMTPL